MRGGRHVLGRQGALGGEQPLEPRAGLLLAEVAAQGHGIDPHQIAHDFSEPVIVRVTIQNTTDVDLPIGNDSVLRPDLWFDAQIRGVAQQNLMGSGYEKLWHEVVLQPHATFQTSVSFSRTRPIAAGDPSKKLIPAASCSSRMGAR